MEANELILYQPNDTLKLDVRVEDDTVWLTQQQIADLFGTKRPAITKHLNNIFKSGELEEESTCSILEHMASDGSRKYNTKYYNLDAILSVGYRVNSKNATRFRQWANKVLKDYMLRGYSITQRLQVLEDKNDRRFMSQENRLDKLEEKVDFIIQSSIEPRQGVFFDGQIFDAYMLIADLIRMAYNRIVLIDNYVDDTVLKQLTKRRVGIPVEIYTNNITPQLRQDIERHNAQYPRVMLHRFSRAHDRFLIIDEDVYHIGASLKDLGKKLFAFSKMNVITASELIGRIKSVD